MSQIEVKLERSVFPITHLFLSIGTQDYSLKPGELKQIKLPKEGKYEILVSSYWIKNQISMPLKNNSTIKVKHILPDIFYLIGIPTILLLSTLTFIGLVDLSTLSIALLIYFTPLMYFTFFGKEKYFKIVVDNK